MDKKTAFIVDDAPENLDILSGILSADYTVKAAPKGAIALKIAAKVPQPDIILLDVLMPEMDGHEVCRKLKDDPVTSGIPVIFVSSNDQKEEIDKGLSLGAADYLFKPVNPEKLKATVSKFIK